MVEIVPIGAVIVAFCALVAVAPLRRPRALSTVSWLAGNFPNELPFVFGLVAITPSVVALTDGRELPVTSSLRRSPRSSPWRL